MIRGNTMADDDPGDPDEVIATRRPGDLSVAEAERRRRAFGQIAAVVAVGSAIGAFGFGLDRFVLVLGLAVLVVWGTLGPRRLREQVSPLDWRTRNLETRRLNYRFTRLPSLVPESQVDTDLVRFSVAQSRATVRIHGPVALLVWLAVMGYLGARGDGVWPQVAIGTAFVSVFCVVAVFGFRHRMRRTLERADAIDARRRAGADD